MQTQNLVYPHFLNNYSEPCQNISRHDFVKKIQPLKQEPNSFITITENQDISLFQVNNINGQWALEQKAKKKSGTYIYDVAPIPNNSINIESQDNMDMIAVSTKNTPIHIYKFLTEPGKTTFKHITSFSYIRFNSEYFVDFLAMQYDYTSNNILLGGKNTLLSYDLTTLQFGYRSKKIGKKEIISCLAMPEDNPGSIVACGNFDRGIKLFSLESDEVVAELNAHVGGLTCLKFSPLDSNYLFSGARKDNLVYLWDLRNTSTFVTYYERKGFTNQRLNFEVSMENYLYLGNEDGSIVAYDLKDNTAKYYFQAGKECVNNIAFSYLTPEKQAFMITSSGSRNFNLENDLDNPDDKDDEDSDAEDKSNLFVPKAQASLVTNNNMTLWAINFDQLVDKSTYQSIPFNPQVPQENQNVQEVQETNPFTEVMTVEKEETVITTAEVIQTGQTNPQNETEQNQ